MHPRASQLVRKLGLVPHPEGGWYREVFRSERTVVDATLPGPRSALTAIYFLLAEGATSRWHRVASDEVWHHYEGDPLELLTAQEATGLLVARRVGPADEGAPAAAVPAGTWQAARTTGEYTLAGCTVAPGFTFEDFELLRERPDALARLARLGFHPGDLL